MYAYAISLTCCVHSYNIYNVDDNNKIVLYHYDKCVVPRKHIGCHFVQIKLK